METRKNFLSTAPYIDRKYKGNLTITGYLYKNKWNASIGLMFGRYIKRYFILNMQDNEFGYSQSHKNPVFTQSTPLSVFFLISID